MAVHAYALSNPRNPRTNIHTLHAYILACDHAHTHTKTRALNFPKLLDLHAQIILMHFHERRLSAVNYNYRIVLKNHVTKLDCCTVKTA